MPQRSRIETARLDATKPEDIAAAARLLREGRLVAIPTETVYGLGANATSAEAVAGIFAAKERPDWDPLIVHLADAKALERVAELADTELRRRVSVLAERFWPGPLTMLVPRTKVIPDAVTAGRPLVGVRVPAHPVAREVLRQAGVPVAAPSANRFGHTSPTTAAHVLADLDGRIDAVLDAGPCAIGVESTVLDVTQTPMLVYRPGAVSVAEIEEVTGVAVSLFEPRVASAEVRDRVALPSPGVGLRHYAPRARLVLTEGSADAVNAMVRRLAEELEKRIGVLLPAGWQVETAGVVEPWAAWDDAEGLAAKLFSGLRALDDRGVMVTVCPLPEPGPGMAAALRDRLLKAARSE